MPTPANKKKVWEIVKLWTKEASFVPKGANPGARQMFWKAAPDGAVPGGLLGKVRSFFEKVAGAEQVAKDSTDDNSDELNPPSTADILADRELWNAWYEIRSAFDEACYLIRDSDAVDKPARLLRAVQEFASAVEGSFGSFEKAAPFLKMLDDRVSAFGEQAIEKEAWDLNEFNTMLDLLEKEAKAPGRETVQGEGDTMKFSDFLALFKKATPEEKTAFAKEMPKDVLMDLVKAHQDPAALPVPAPAPVATLVALAALVKCPDCGKKFDPAKAIAKEDINLEDLPAPVREQLVKAKATEEKVERLEKEKLETLCKEQAEGLGLDVPTTSALLFKAHRGEPVKVEELQVVLKASSEQSKAAQKILFQEKGHTRTAPKPDSAEAKVMVLTKAAMEVDKKLTQDLALAKVLEDNIELADEYNNETRVSGMPG